MTKAPMALHAVCHDSVACGQSAPTNFCHTERLTACQTFSQNQEPGGVDDRQGLVPQSNESTLGRILILASQVPEQHPLRGSASSTQRQPELRASSSVQPWCSKPGAGAQLRRKSHDAGKRRPARRSRSGIC